MSTLVRGAIFRASTSDSSSRNSVSTLVRGASPQGQTQSENFKTFNDAIGSTASQENYPHPVAVTHNSDFERLRSRILDLEERLNAEFGIQDSYKLVKKAISWFYSMTRDGMAVSGVWLRPHLTISEEGEIVFEWENSNKSLTIYISLDQTTFIEAWGADMATEMRDGQATSVSVRHRLWKELVS